MMHRNRLLFAVCACALLLQLNACATRHQHPQAWQPEPATQWINVGSAGARAGENQSLLLTPPESVGRFPSSIAVSRVALAEVDGGHPVAYLPSKPKNEFLQWNRAFDDLMAISSVFPIAQRDLGGGPATPEQVIAASRALRAGLCLVYAINRVSLEETEMIGVLYQTDPPIALASFHARAETEVPRCSECGAPLEDEDAFTQDSRAIVRRRFENLVYDTVRGLILNDEPERIDIPQGWIREREVVWPPVQGSPPNMPPR